MPQTIKSTVNEVMEWGYVSPVKCDDPFNELELDVVIKHGDGETWAVPAFWAGGQQWRVRFAPPRPGTYEVKASWPDSLSSDDDNEPGLLDIRPYEGSNPLLKHGGLRVAGSKRTLEHADGTPFLWLGDTWWMGLCRRLKWPEDFERLAADREAKGFSVVQIVAGLYPDMAQFDERGKNEAGYPWEKEYTRINPAYFDKADERIEGLVRHGFVPCIVGAWGYYLPLLGVERMKRHWRNLIARWGAWPVVWCLAGEAAMPYYLSKNRDEDRQMQMDGWTEIGRFVHEIDPMKRPVTIHPTEVGRDQVTDPGVLDFDMLQTGHNGYDSIPNTASKMIAGLARTPVMPVIDGEVNYEGFLHGNYDEVQRMAFWCCMLSGAAGHTYGANGIWQVNTREQPYGPSPHGNTWGNRPWDEAMALPGSGQLGLGKALLLKYGWPAFEPHQEWVEPSANEMNRWGTYVAGIPGQVRIIYSFQIIWGHSMRVKGIESGVDYRACFINPSTGEVHDLGAVEAEADGSWLVPFQPEMRDWLLVLETEEHAKLRGA